MTELETQSFDPEATNDRLAVEHPIEDYYANSPLAVRVVESRRLRIIRSFLGDVRDLEVLEVGSGGGHVLAMFPSARLTAVDVSDEFLAIARRNLRGYRVAFLKGELTSLRLPEHSFDRIVCTETLEHVADPEELLAECARLLRPSGVAAITVPNDALIARVKSVLKRVPIPSVRGKRIEWGGSEFHLHRWSPREFEAVLARHFRVTDRRAAPVNWIPLRACFRCVPLGEEKARGPSSQGARSAGG